MSDRPQSRKPADTPFKQQKLKAWQPILTPKWVIFTFILVGAIFLPIGIAIFLASAQINEFSTDFTNCAVGTTCLVSINITTTMQPPVYVYYQLTNFYQNHRRYVQSRDDNQLRGAVSTNGNSPVAYSDASSAVSDCSPAVGYTNNAGTQLVYYPCGLVALSWYNDTFSLYNPGTPPYTAVPWNNLTGLAWPSDVSKKFSQASSTWMSQNCYAIGTLNGQNQEISGFSLPLMQGNPSGAYHCWHNVSDEKFIVWMRTAGLPDFKKLYAQINVPIPAGVYTIQVDSRYNVTSFGGTKSFVMSTTAWIGGKNNFLGIAYLVVGSLCMLMGAIFLAKHLISPRTLGDEQYLVWKQ